MKFNKLLFYILVLTGINGFAQNLPILSNLKCWFVGDSSHAVFNQVDTLYDLSGNSNHAIQSNATQQPINNASFLNGHKTISFDDLNDYLKFTAIPDIRTVFWVIKENPGPTGPKPLLGHTSLSTYNFHRGALGKIWDGTGATDPNVVNGNTKLNFNLVNGTSTTLPTQFSLVSLVTTGNVTADNFGTDRNFAGRFWNGDLAELIIYNQALTPAEVNQVEQYLNDKYAPPVILPPDITIVNSFCDTTLTTNTSFVDYLWSNGLTTPTIAVNQSGKYWVRATSVFGIVSSDTILVQYPTLVNLTKNYFCSNDTLIWNTQLPKSEFTFAWQNSASDSLFKIYQPGPYYVTVNDAFGCSISSNTINVSEDTFPITATLGPDVSICLGNLITLTSGASPSLTYVWSTGSVNDSLLITISGQYSVVVTNTNNCVAVDTISVTILGQAPTADFSFNNGCINSAITFTNLSSPPGGNTITATNWSFGDLSASNTSTLTNPSHTYTTSGTYFVSLQVITNAGCQQSIIKTITISPTPTPDFTSASFCQNDSTAFVNQSTSLGGYSITASSWNFGDTPSGINNTSNIYSPKHLFTSPAIYNVKLIVTNSAGCKDSIIKPIQSSTSYNSTIPQSFSGLKLWVMADCAKSAPLSKVDTLYDLSGNFNHAIQSTISQQPIISSTFLNGHKTVKFDSIDDFLKFNAISDIRTVFWVIKENPGLPAARPLLGHTSAGAYNFHRGSQKYIWSNPDAATGVLNGITNLNFNAVNGTVTPLPAQFSLVSLVTTGTVTADNFGTDRNLAGRFWNGDLAELIIYNQALSPVQVNQVEQYLNAKYAPPVKLPADITVTNSFCDTIITTNSSFVDYLWSNGATTPTISVNKSGKYWVKTTSSFGMVTSDTILVNFPNYHLPTQNVICTGNQLKWDTQLAESNYTFLWQDVSTTDSVFTITQAGNYYVNITDSYSCTITSDTVKITIDNFPVTGSLGPDIPLCSGNSITLTSGLSSSLSYTWSTGSINDSLLITNSGQYSVIVTNTNNCVAKDTIIVTINGFAPTANFTTTIGCANKAVSFTDLSIPPSGNSISNYEWSFGDTASPTNTSTASNPLHTYTNTGTYTVVLTVTTNSNCEQSITKIINVYPVPTASFSIGTSCQNDSTAFLNLSTSTVGYPLTSYSWNFGDSNTSNAISPKHVYTNVLTYSITLVATNSVGCSSSVIKTLTPKYEVKANFTNGPACENNATNFQSTSIIPPTGTPTYDWNFGTGMGVSNVLSPSKTFTSSGVYSVTLTVNGNNGCVSTITKLVNVYLPPVANFSFTSFCSKDTINIINTSNAQSGILSLYDWKLNTTSFSAVQNPTLSLTTPTTYSVKLEVTNSFGCKDATTKTVTVFPLPTVDFSTTPVAFYYINEPVNFTPSNTNASSYLWSMNGTSTYTIQSPTETFNAEGSYNVSLILKDQNGCKGSKTKNITVSNRYLDLAILNVSTTKDNDGFMTVVADIANYGSVPITSFKMGYQISDGGSIKETWNGTLNPNSFYVYTFNATSASNQNSANHITCVEIEKVNTIIDADTSNNSLCTSLNTDEINVSNPLPNPTNGDIILPITLNRDLDYTIAIYNSVGQIQYEETTQKGIQGLNFVTLNTSSYARGCYIIKTMIDGNIFIKKFIKISYE